MRIRTVTLSELSTQEWDGLIRRGAVPDGSVRDRAAEIVASIRAGGDRALAEAGRRFGGSPDSGPNRLSPGLLQEATQRVDAGLLSALDSAIESITVVHEPQLPTASTVESVPGVTVTRSWTPLRRIAAYVPGGGAVYPSSLLMSVVPAKIAGVEQIVVATPCNETGSVPDEVLAAADRLDVDEVYPMGGAQAVAALAYGTESIPPVEKVVGPGNAWVTAAKLQVMGHVAVDLPAGPSEALVVSDGSVDARVVAADMLCQAEHGPDCPVVLVTTAPDEIPAVLDAIEDFLPTLAKRSSIRKALANHGLIAVAADRDAALSFADAFAAEHVSLLTSSAAGDAERVTSAGSVFVGAWAPESAGDYATGANHILPTGGLARSHSPLGVEDFGSWRQVQHVTKEGLETLRPTVSTLAEAEGLTAHSLAVSARFAVETAGVARETQ